MDKDWLEAGALHELNTTMVTHGRRHFACHREIVGELTGVPVHPLCD